MTIETSSFEFPSLTHSDAWEHPILFEEFETPEIPARLLPGIFGEFATALAQSTETPDALSVMTVLGVISTTIAKRFVVSPKKNWYEPLNIYTLIALPPANNKSLVLSCCTKPLVEWEKGQALKLECEIKSKRSERKTQEKIIEALRIQAAKAKTPIEQQKLIQDIALKESMLVDIPNVPVLFVNDVTPESLTTLMQEQNGRLAIFSDEGGILETLAGLYNNGLANIDILLKGIDGGDIRVRRKDRSITINPFLTIALTVQPIIIQKMGEKRAYFGNGTLERFLYVLPKSKLGYRTHDKPPLSTEIQNAYHQKIKDLLDAFYFTDKSTNQHVLTLSPFALMLWREFQSKIEIQLRPDGIFSVCQGWAGKTFGIVLRIAGLLHVAKHDCQNLIIDEHTMKNALDLVNLLTVHTIAAYNLMGIDQVTEDAKSILQWIKTQNKNMFSQSDLVLAMRNKKLGKSERLQKAIHKLHERNIISQPLKVPTRKPTTIYYVNPVLIAGGT